jgi:hypothetical protein
MRLYSLQTIVRQATPRLIENKNKKRQKCASKRFVHKETQYSANTIREE